MKNIFSPPLFVLISILQPSTSFSASITSSGIVEDFTTLDYADLTTSTGVWNIIDQQARARAYADGANTSTRPIDFGNGSDGVLDSSTGYAFDTNTHPTGYHFISVNITNGPITVTGSNPLIIRSLSTVNIVPPITANGGNGDVGDATGTTVTGPSTPTCSASNGGNGGSATIAAANNGGDGIQPSGAPEGAGSEGIGEVNAAQVPGVVVDAKSNAGNSQAGNDFETASNFVCGIGGAGGGGFSNTTNFAAGSAGGGGGGVVKIVAVGNITLGAIEAKGGNGGNGATVPGGGCSGSGAAGSGGVIFLQSLASITATPDVSGGTGGDSSCVAGLGPSVFSGFVRGDMNSLTARPGWATDVVTTGGTSYDTDIVPASLTSIIQSKAYDLQALDVTFGTPQITTAGGGSIAVTYAGSEDGTTFSAFTSDISTLSNQGYRYLKWRATITNPGAPGASPHLTQVSIPFTKVVPDTLKVKLSYGCAMTSLVGAHHQNTKNKTTEVATTLFWITTWMLMFKFRRRIFTKPSRADTY